MKEEMLIWSRIEGKERKKQNTRKKKSKGEKEESRNRIKR
jgi:hypothetical protein